MIHLLHAATGVVRHELVADAKIGDGDKREHRVHGSTTNPEFTNDACNGSYETALSHETLRTAQLTGEATSLASSCLLSLCLSLSLHLSPSPLIYAVRGARGPLVCFLDVASMQVLA